MPKHQIKHYIVTQGPPLHAHARRFLPDKLIAAKAEFEIMEEFRTLESKGGDKNSPLEFLRMPFDLKRLSLV